MKRIVMLAMVASASPLMAQTTAPQGPAGAVPASSSAPTAIVFSEKGANGMSDLPMGVGINARLNMNDPKVISALAAAKSRYEGAADAYVPQHVSDARIPRDRLATGRQLAAMDVRLDNRVTVVDRNGNEMGNTVTQSQTRIGAPIPAGTAKA